jgi:glycosyltransferase involved in cell wall biosynthesis
LAKQACRCLIALSDNAAAFQRRILRGHDLAKAIESKITVLHPPQTLGRQIEKPRGKIHFVIVGSEFFRKGGLEVLRVFGSALASGEPVKLTIVSDLRYGDDATKSTKREVGEARRIISAHPDSIQHFSRLPNESVMELFQDAHVCLLPTWAETYGYSVLEAQASGCAVVSTNIRALPEINNSDVGYMIEVPKKETGEAAYGQTLESREIFSQIVQRGLRSVLEAVLDAPHRVVEKGHRARQRIQREHDPSKHAERLEEIYSASFAH